MRALVGKIEISIVSAGLLVSAPGTARVAETSLQDLTGKDTPAGAVWLNSMDLSSVTNSWGHVTAGKSLGKSVGGQALTLEQRK